MKRVSFPFFLLCLALLVLTPTAAHAFLNTVNFTFSYTDPIAGPGTAAGSFSFDSSILPSAGGWLNPVTDPWNLSFTFAGRTFTTSDTGPRIQSDPSGNIIAWSLYSDPNTLSVAPGFVLDAYYSNPPTGEMRWMEANYWTVPNLPNSNASSGRWSLAVPEPGALSLIGLGLPFLLLVRRPRR